MSLLWNTARPRIEDQLGEIEEWFGMEAVNDSIEHHIHTGNPRMDMDGAGPRDRTQTLVGQTEASRILQALARGEIHVDDAMRQLDDLAD